MFVYNWRLIVAVTCVPIVASLAKVSDMLSRQYSLEVSYLADSRFLTSILYLMILIASLSSPTVAKPLSRYVVIVIATIWIYLLCRIDFSLSLFGHSDKSGMYRNFGFWRDSLGIAAMTYFFTRKTTVRKRHTPHQLFTPSLVVYAIFSAAIIGYISCWMLIDEHHSYLTNGLNFQIVLHSIVQSYYETFPGFEIASQYGSYGIFLGGALSLFSIDLSVLSITAAMAFMNLVALSLIAFLIAQVSGHLLLRASLLATTCYWLYFGLTLWPGEKYYQMYPIRLVVPAFVLSALFWATNAKHQTKFLTILGVLTGFGLLWNLETGLVCFGAVTISYFRARLFREAARIMAVTVIIFTLLVLIISAIGQATFRPHLFLQYFLYWSDQKTTSSNLVFERAWILIVALLAYALTRVPVTDVKNSGLIFTTLGLLVYHLFRGGRHDSNMTVAIWLMPLICVSLVSALRSHQPEVTLMSKITKRALWMTVCLSLGISSSAFIHIQRGTITRDTNLLHHYFDKSSSRIGFVSGNPKDQNPLSVTISDQLAGRLSPWEIRSNIAKSLAGASVRSDLLIISDFDALMYLHANAAAPVTWANWIHAFDDRHFKEAIQRILDGTISNVLVDLPDGGFTTPPITFSTARNTFLKVLYTCLEPVKQWNGGSVYVYPTNANLLPDPTRKPFWADSTLSLFTPPSNGVAINECVNGVADSL